VERLHRTLTDHLRVMIDDRQGDWDKMAQLFLLGYRTLPHATTQISPCMLMYGRQLLLPAELEYGVPFQQVVEKSSGQYAQQLRESPWHVHEQACQNIRSALVTSKRRYDFKTSPADFQIRDIVWVFNPKKMGGLTRKLSPQWEGPYTIIRKISDVCFQIQKSPRSRMKTVHADRLRLVKRPPALTPPPAPLAVTFNAETTSRNIIGLRST